MSGGQESKAAAPAVLELVHVRKVFARRGQESLAAVEDSSFAVGAGESVGLVGESGSGKTTTAQMVLGLLAPTSGQVLVDGRDVRELGRRERRDLCRAVQAVFQDPMGSFDPRRTLGYSVCEGMRNVGESREEARRRALALFARCGLGAELFSRYPREVSGGQCQRAAIARALAMDPKLLLCDEATSALDATVQRQVVELLLGLCRERGLAMLFISHDLALVGQLCDRVLVMEKGRIVESGPVEEVLLRPQHPYTQRLLASAL